MENNKPVKSIKFGAIEASIWENENAEGRKTYSVTFKRSYKDGEEWKTAESFWPEHLPLLVKAADAAHTVIYTELKGK